jgi:hypothetical protein
MSTQYSDAQLNALITALTSSVNTLARVTGASHSGGAASSSRSTRSSNMSAFGEAAMDDYERQLRLNSKNLTAQNRLLKESTAAFRNLIGAAASDPRGTSSGSKAERVKKAQEQLAQSTEGVKQTQDKLTIEYTKLIRLSLPQQVAAFKNLVKGTTGLSNNFSVVQRNSSLMNAALISRAAEINSDTTSADHAKYVSQLTDATKILKANDMSRSMLVAMNLIDEAANEFNNNLMPDDFSQLRIRMGEANVALGEAFKDFSSMSGKSVEEMLSEGILKTYNDANASNAVPGQGEEMQASMAAAFEQLKSLKVKLPSDVTEILSRMQSGDFGNVDPKDEEAKITVNKELSRLAEVLETFYKTTAETTQRLDKIGVNANTALGAIKRKFSLDGLAEAGTNKIGELSTYAGTVAALSKTATALLAIMSETSDFNVASIATSYLDVQQKSIAMGMSFDETTKFMLDNKRVMANYGASAFGSLRSGFENTFNEFGYSFKQAAAIIAPATEAAISSGVDTSNENALNGYMRKTMESFNKLSGIININAAEYASLNSELFGGEDVMKTMLGMTAAQSQAYSDNLESQRNELHVRGLSIQQAQDAIKIQEAAKRAKVRERFEGGAKLMVQMGALGFSAEEQMRAYHLSVKGMRKTTGKGSETEEYQKLLERVAARRGTYETEAVGLQQGTIRDFMLEATSPGADIENQLDMYSQMAIKERAKIGTSEEARARSQEAAKPDNTIMHLTEIRETAVSIATNSLTVAALAGAAAITGLTFSSGLAAKSLLALAGSGAGSLVSGLGKALLPLGATMLRGGAALGSAGLVAGAGVAGYGVGTLLVEPINKLTSTLTGSQTTLGGWIYDLFNGGDEAADFGTKTTKAASGLATGVYDVYNASPSSTSKSSISPPEREAASSELINSSRSASGIIQVSDVAAQNQLVQIAQVLNEAVRLLAIIAPQNTPTFKISEPMFGRRNTPQAVDAF